ncbi:MAG: VWA domain-containing protein [Myxococcales bacterium]|nr:VWA domain-containing protein [Myxococcales bacterium]
MSLRRLLDSPRARRGIAASAIVLSLGGLVLVRTPSGATAAPLTDVSYLNGTTFSGPGASGSLSLSHVKFLAHGRQPIYAELRLRADDQGANEEERAPLALAVVIDTSGSMEGDKIEEARRSVLRLIDGMRDDDEIALIRYDSHPELIQGMARVGEVRRSLRQRVLELQSSGGTNIPAALSEGMDALRDASAGRVRRLVLVSDGLDSTRQQSEALARSGTDRGVTVSALGIGLDFDEGYMAAIARAGRGNFGFVEDASSLAKFLERELSETATTKVERARARFRLPKGLRFVRAVGADARHLGDGEVELRVGSLYAGDERRVVVELAADAEIGESLAIATEVSWDAVGGDSARLDLSELSVVATDDAQAVAQSRDGRVFASSASALASLNQLEAAEAYKNGDVTRARQIIEDNVLALEEAAAAAPADAGDGLRKQAKGYADSRDEFERTPPGSAEGRAASKRAAEKDTANLGRSIY